VKRPFGEATILYEHLLAGLSRRGFTKSPETTPREFARTLPARESGLVDRFTTLYYSVRYGGNSADMTEMAAMLKEFEQSA
jgi:hypothetical protein